MEFLLYKSDANKPCDSGITPAKPEHERAFLLGWIVSLLLIVAIAIALLLSWFLESSAKAPFGGNPERAGIRLRFQNTPFAANLI